jgi:hypothetical protein
MWSPKKFKKKKVKMVNNGTASLRAERSNPFLFASFPRRRESPAKKNALNKEIPAYAGMTALMVLDCFAPLKMTYFENNLGNKIK